MHTTHNDCLFCNIANGIIQSDTVYEDDVLRVFRDIAPKAPVHLLVVPKYHIESLATLTEADDSFITHAMHRLGHIAQEAGLADGFRTIINTGIGGGQEVFHLHLHILGGFTGNVGFSAEREQ